MPIPVIGPALEFMANLLGFLRGRQDLKNAPEIKANAQAKTDQEISAQGAKIIADQDEDAAAKAISE